MTCVPAPVASFSLTASSSPRRQKLPPALLWSQCNWPAQKQKACKKNIPVIPTEEWAGEGKEWRKRYAMGEERRVWVTGVMEG